MIQAGGIRSVDVSNVLIEVKKQKVIALGRLGWPLRRIQEETGVRRETAGSYLKAAGVAIRPPGAWGRRPLSNPANEVTPGSWPPPSRAITASACEPHKDFVEVSLVKGRNAKAIWQDLVDDHGSRGSCQSVNRFVRRVQAKPNAELASAPVSHLRK